MMMTHSERDHGRYEGGLTREERMTLSLLRIVTDLATIRRDVEHDDFERLPSLPSLLEAADRLIAELGFDDEE
jgi:hypothetical protein